MIPGDFDDEAFWAALDAERRARDMSWAQVNREIGWISPLTFTRWRERRSSACQVVMPFIQWVGRTPESLMVGAGGSDGELLPDPGEGRWRWYWDILELRAQLESRRTEREMTWPEVADEMGCSRDDIKFLYRTRYGTSMTFAMRAARWLDRTAASLMWEHDGLGLPWSPRRVTA